MFLADLVCSNMHSSASEDNHSVKFAELVDDLLVERKCHYRIEGNGSISLEFSSFLVLCRSHETPSEVRVTSFHRLLTLVEVHCSFYSHRASQTSRLVR